MKYKCDTRERLLYVELKRELRKEMVACTRRKDDHI